MDGVSLSALSSPLVSPAPPEDRLEAAYADCFPLIAAKCRRMLDDETEAHDVAQETFLKLWQTERALLDRPDELVAWIYRASTRLAIDRLRRRRVRERLTPAAESHGGDLEEQLIARQRLQQLAGEGTEDEVAAAILSRLDGLEQKEIAVVLKVSERTVRRLLARFDARIAKEAS
jgi:RNA polymerase sigma-70 factor, ECF subfamily